MWNLRNKKKGNTLIEVLVALFVLSSFTVIIMTLKISYGNLQGKIKRAEERIPFVSSLKNELLMNTSSDKLREEFNGKKLYIKKENLKMEKLKENNLESLLINSEPREFPYTSIYIEENNLMEIYVKMYYKENEVKDYVFYKGLQR